METETRHRLVADDLFAGAGGWDIAADWLDVHACGVENMPQARATRDAAGLTTIHDDVWTFKPRYIGRDLTASGLIASPPCQTFSQAGKGAGRKALDDVLALIPNVSSMSLQELRDAGAVFGDERTALVLTPLWFALHHPYRWLAWEQVPTVLPVWEACAVVLRAHGYSVVTGNLQAEQYGVPQTRKRAVLIASRDLEVSLPTPTHSRYYPRTPERLDDGVAKWVSMAEALGWDDRTEVVSNYGSGGDASARGVRTGAEPAATVTSKVDRNVVRHPIAMTQEVGQALLRNGVKPHRGIHEPAVTVTGGAPNNEGGGLRHRWAMTEAGLTRGAPFDPEQARPDWCYARPSTMVVGSFKPEVIAAPGYRTTVSRQDAPDSVRVTVAEAGVLQSFPADYPWQGAKGKQFLQCGNAIPPLLAMAVLCAALGEPYVPPTEPVRSDAQPGDAGVVLRNNNTANAAVRAVETPAPTLYFGQRCNYVAWESAPATN